LLRKKNVSTKKQDTNQQQKKNHHVKKKTNNKQNRQKPIPTPKQTRITEIITSFRNRQKINRRAQSARQK